MHQEVEPGPFSLDRGKHGIDARIVRHVARQHDLRADLGGERLDALLDGVALIGEGDLGAIVMAGLGDPPSDRAVIRNAKHKPAFARH